MEAEALAEFEAFCEVPGDERTATKLRMAVSKWHKRYKGRMESYVSDGCGCCVILIRFRAPASVVGQLRRIGQDLGVPLDVEMVVDD